MSSSLVSFLNTALVLTFALLCFYFLLRRSSSVRANAPPKAGGAWPLIGHLPLLARTDLHHILFGDLADKYGPIYIIRIGIYPAVVVSSWKLAKELFTTNDIAVSERPKLTGTKLLGHNFANFAFCPYGEYWRQMRKITATELLSNRKLELLKHIRTSEVEDLVRDLYKIWTEKKNEAGQVLVEMKQRFNDLNLNVILRMIAGKRYFGNGAVGDKKEARRCQKAMRQFFHLLGLFVLRDAIPFLGWLDLGGYEKDMKRNFKEFDGLVGEWLEEHIRRKESGEIANNKEQDFMDVLLSVLDGIDLGGYDADTVRKATASVLIAAGTDSMTVTMTWGLTLLLNNPIAIKKAQEELDIQVGKERLVNDSDIEKLVYLQAIVKETLRFYPAAPLSGPREFSEDCTIGGYHIPAGTRLVVNLHKIQRDPSVWSNPNEFNPDRFLGAHKDVDVKGQHFELIPFGAGRRACAGINFAVQLIPLVLASLLQAFEISTPSDEPVDTSATLGLTCQKVNPLEVLLKPRLPAHLYEREV